MSARWLILLTFIVVSFVWLFPAFDSHQEQTAAQDEVFVPEFTAKLLHQEMYDSNGAIQQEVFSRQMEHFSELSLTYFVEPEFIIYQNQQPLWRLAAKVGNMQDGILTLDEQVTMVQIKPDSLVQTITTEFLEIDLNKKLVKTDNPITIESDSLFVQGQGLHADLNEGRVRLTHHVRTHIKGKL